MKLFVQKHMFLALLFIMSMIYLGQGLSIAPIDTITSVPTIPPPIFCKYGYVPGTKICKCAPGYIRNVQGKCVRVFPPIGPFPVPKIPDIPLPDPPITKPIKNLANP